MIDAMVSEFVTALTEAHFQPPRGMSDLQQRERVAMMREAAHAGIPSDAPASVASEALGKATRALVFTAKTQAWPLPSEVLAAVRENVPAFQRPKKAAEVDVEREKVKAENAEAIRNQARAIAIACRDDEAPPPNVYDAAVVMAISGDRGRAERLNAWWKRHGGPVNLTPPALSAKLGLSATEGTGDLRRMP